MTTQFDTNATNTQEENTMSTPLMDAIHQVRDDYEGTPASWWDSLPETEREEIRDLIRDPAIPDTAISMALSSESIPADQRWAWSESSWRRIANQVRKGRL